MTIPRLPTAAVRAGLALAALAFAAPPAGAYNFTDMDPLAFPSGGANTGLTNAGPGFDFALDPTLVRICAGAGVFQPVASCDGRSAYDISITQQLERVRQFPQASGSQPSSANPFVADSRWTATNDTEQAYERVLLLFTSVNLAPFPGAIAASGYPDLPVSLDGNLVKIVKYTAGGMDYFYGAVDLGRLEPGESRDFLVRYIVGGGPMPIDGRNYVIPPLKIMGVLVPEPGTLVLLLSGLVGLGLAGRPR